MYYSGYIEIFQIPNSRDNNFRFLRSYRIESKVTVITITAKTLVQK